MANPIVDLSCTRIRFEPGDRVIVRLRQSMTREQISHVKRTVQNWAGKDVRVIVYNPAAMEIEIEKQHAGESGA